MVRFVPKRLFEAALIALVALSLATAAFSHRAPSRADLELAGLQASLGVAADLCGQTGSDSGNSKSCEFCRMAANVLAPEVGFDLHRADTQLLAEIVLPDIHGADALDLDRTRHARGPPRA